MGAFQSPHLTGRRFQVAIAHHGNNALHWAADMELREGLCGARTMGRVRRAGREGEGRPNQLLGGQLAGGEKGFGTELWCSRRCRRDRPLSHFYFPLCPPAFCPPPSLAHC